MVRVKAKRKGAREREHHDKRVKATKEWEKFCLFLILPPFAYKRDIFFKNILFGSLQGAEDGLVVKAALYLQRRDYFL